VLINPANHKINVFDIYTVLLKMYFYETEIPLNREDTVLLDKEYMMNKRVVGRLMIIKWAILVGLFVLALGMVACGDKTPSEKAKATGDAVGDAVGDAAKTAGDAVGDAAKTAGDAAGDAAKTAGDAVGDAIQATDDFLTQSKDEGVKVAQEKLDEIEKNWQDLLAKAEPATSEAKVDLQKAKEQMDTALADAKVKLMKAKAASEDGWKQDAKPALDAALQKAQKLYEDTLARFGSK
jgi:hypothetical protein